MCSMGNGGAKTDVRNDEQTVLGIIAQLDESASETYSEWSNKRRSERRRVRGRCLVFFVGGARASLVKREGRLRDISTGGLGFVSQEHFRRRTPVLIALLLAENKTKHLSGHVVYSRAVRDGWYLSGVEFGPTEDERLTPAAVQATPIEEGSAPVAEESGPQKSAREQAMELLRQASSGWALSAEKVEKIIGLAQATDHVVRRAAIPVLMQLGDIGATDALRKLLQDANVDIQAEAADALGQLNVPEAREELAELLQSKHETLVLSAAQALGRMGDQRGLRMVAQVVNSESPLNRRAARALGFIVGQEFRPNSDGLAAARAYLKKSGAG